MANAERRLTQDQLELLRRKLEEERRRIVTLLRGPAATVASDGELSEYEENAQRSAERSDQLEIAERERLLLAEVERALERLRAGTYGVDEETGDPIPYERLSAIPWARGSADG